METSSWINKFGVWYNHILEKFVVFNCACVTSKKYCNDSCNLFAWCWNIPGCVTHTIHVWRHIHTYMYQKNQPNDKCIRIVLGKYTIYMNPMGYSFFLVAGFLSVQRSGWSIDSWDAASIGYSLWSLHGARGVLAYLDVAAWYFYKTYWLLGLTM